MRAAGKALEDAMRVFPVVVVTGARQTGKSTLVQTSPALAGRPYLTLDDLTLRDQALRDPESLVARSTEMILDEVQRAPDLLLAVKRLVDQDRPRRPGRFVLTGAANLLLMERVSESLAGRAGYITLRPLARRERLGLGATGIWSEMFDRSFPEWAELVEAQDAPAEDWQELARLGGLPVPAHELGAWEERARWLDGYVATYLERDLQTLSSTQNLGDFRRLMIAAALRVGGILNQAELARDVAISRPTAHRWLELLETSYQTVRLPSYSVNRTKRLMKSPRLFFGDVGLAVHLAGGRVTGAHLENLVLCDLLVWRELQVPRAEISFWRTANDEEVDFVIERGRELIAVEVKATVRPAHAHARHLFAFMEEYGSAVRGGLLLHGGEETFRLGERVLAAPWWRVI